MDMSAAAASLAVPLLLIAMAIYHVSGNIARLAKALEAKNEERPKLQV